MTRIMSILTLFLYIGALACLSGCSAKSQPSENHRREYDSFSWMICDENAEYSGDWTQYSVLNQISAKSGILPQTEIVTEEIDRTVTKMLLSQSVPDVVTLRLDDQNFQKLLVSDLFCKLELTEAVNDRIPKDILKFHCDFNDCLPYIPGGWVSSNKMNPIACEGIYVHSGVFSAKEIRAVTDLSSVLSLLKRMDTGTLASGVTDSVLLGQNGFQTLEHLFGISPADGCRSEDGYPPHSDELLKFFGELCKTAASGCTFGIGASSERIPLIYIGESTIVERWNAAFGEEIYTPLNVFGNAYGFLAAYSPYGTYATFVAKGEKQESATSFLLDLLQEDTSRAMMYGVKNYNWLIDAQHEQIVIPNNTKQRVLRGDYALVKEYGIAVFPYLSSQYAVFPGYATGQSCLRDILAEQMLLCGDPTKEPQKTNRAKADKLQAALYAIVKQ